MNGVTDTEFFNYQISGAVGIALKLYGRIDADALLRGTSYLDNPRAADIRQAAVELKDVKIHGCIMADEVGFGKTKQVLLAAYLHTILSKEEEDGELLFRPILLVVPPTLINQWLEELRSHWPCFRSVISYEDHEFKQEMALSAISHTAMKEYPSLEALPRELRYIFDKRDKKAGKTIIITSYETHKGRTGKKKQRRIPGIPYKKPRYTKDGEPIWKKKPRIEKYWVTNHQKVYSLLIADEAQKIKNYSSGTWSVLFCHNFPKTILATATPMFNSVRVSASFISS